MKKPLVAIVGRPNVGKSTFFNRIVGRNISIVKNEPGVTRDRIYSDAEWLGYSFTMVDTGGIDLKNKDEVTKNILNQAQIATELADTILFFVDGKEGLTAADMEVANFLRRSKKNVILVVNKLDTFDVNATYEFYQLGLGEPMPISSEQKKGLGELLDKIIGSFEGEVERLVEEEDVIKIAIVGRPNAGKSSITNKLLGEERSVVSEKAGTTRDALDTHFKYYGNDYSIIDTAGIRRKSKIEYESVEQYSVLRALQAIRRADVVICVFDASVGIAEQDVRILGYVHEQGKPSIVAINKWDLIEKDNKTMNEYLDKLKVDLSFMSYFQPLFISAKTNQRVGQIMPLINKVYENASKRVKTSIINEVIGDAISITPPPSKSGRRLKILFTTQVATNPPTFVIKVNDQSLVHFSYERYLENSIRRALVLEGTPIKLIFRNRQEK
jgi:GTP-binding protein